MLVCVSCNIEFKEDKKFCSYCGGSLTVKEDVVQEKTSHKNEPQSEQKLICPLCHTIYDFGSSCIQCGSSLTAQICSDEKEEPLESEGHTGDHPEKPRVDFICPGCKITYKEGNFCTKCGSPLLPQALTQVSENPEETIQPEAEEEPVQLQTMQEHLAEPRKNLFCPNCKIIYERGTACVRCGSSLVSELPPREEATPEPRTPPDGTSGPTPYDKTSAEAVPASAPKVTSRPRPESPEGSRPHDRLQRQAERMERDELELFSDIGTEDLENFKKDPPARLSDNPEKRYVLPGKRRRDDRRLFLEVGSISIMVLAGGYLLWSVYSHVSNPSEKKSSHPKKVYAPAHVTPPGSLSTTAKVSVPQAPQKEEATPSSPSVPATSDSTDIEALEKGKIRDLLENIRQANLQKDIDLFLSCYATDFKDREGKKKATLSFWRNFDYLELSYFLKNASFTGETARVNIEWVIKTSPKGGRQPQENRTLLNAVLKKEEGSWKIQEVKDAG